MAKKTKKKQQKITKKAGITPLGDRVLVRPFTEAEARGEKNNKHFGIILPETEGKEKSSQGKVIAVGTKAEGIQKGDIILFSKYGYDEVEYSGEEYYLIKLENVLAVIK